MDARIPGRARVLAGMDGDSNGTGLTGCFSCGRAVPDEEPILVVLRRHQRLLPGGALGLSSGVISDISLQICLLCADGAATWELWLRFDPMGVIPLEMDALHWYVKKRWRRSVHWPQSETTGCSDSPESSNYPHSFEELEPANLALADHLALTGTPGSGKGDFHRFVVPADVDV